MLDNTPRTPSDSRPASALERLCSCVDRGHGVPQVTIVAAHPDDEVIGAGGRMVHLRDVHVVHVTDGAPHDMGDAIANGFETRQEYARARAEERARALALATITAERIHDVGIVDQEASFALVELSHEIARLLASTRCDVVLTHAYEGGHPDHDATAFAVRAATELMRRRELPSPAILEFAGYHGRGGVMQTGGFVAHGAASARIVPLGTRERRLKRDMFACYTSQQRVLAAFNFETECFRAAPEYDFTVPPHDGRLFYEWFNWRVTGTEWRRLAEDARYEIGGLTSAC